MRTAVPIGKQLVVLTNCEELTIGNRQLDGLQILEVAEAAEKIIAIDALLRVRVTDQSAAPQFALQAVGES